MWSAAVVVVGVSTSLLVGSIRIRRLHLLNEQGTGLVCWFSVCVWLGLHRKKRGAKRKKKKKRGAKKKKKTGGKKIRKLWHDWNFWKQNTQKRGVEGVVRGFLSLPKLRSFLKYLTGGPTWFYLKNKKIQRKKIQKIQKKNKNKPIHHDKKNCQFFLGQKLRNRKKLSKKKKKKN